MRTCFVLMPFGHKAVDGQVLDFDAVYHEIFEPAIAAVEISEQAGGPLQPVRLDQVVGGGTLAHDAVQYIEFSRFVLADITSLNPNVLYELGLGTELAARGR